MSEVVVPAPVEAALPAPQANMRYGETFDMANANYNKGVTETGLITHVPREWFGTHLDASLDIVPKLGDTEKADKKTFAYKVGYQVGRLLGKFNMLGVDVNVNPNDKQGITEDTPIAEQEQSMTPESSWASREVGSFGVTEFTMSNHLAKIEKMKELHYPREAIEIMEKGTLNGKKIADKGGIYRNGEDILYARKAIADMYVEYPEVANLIVDQEIVGVHGTNSMAFAEILEHGGLLSAAEARKKGVAHLTGEHIFQKAEGQRSISFTTLADTGNALSYAGPFKPSKLTPEEVIAGLESDMAIGQEELDDLVAKNPNPTSPRAQNYRKVIERSVEDARTARDSFLQNPNSLKSQFMMDRFPMLFAISRESTLKGAEAKPDYWQPVSGTSGDYKEFRPAREEIGLEELVVAVPEDKIESIQLLLSQFGANTTTVVPIEAFVNERTKRLHEEFKTGNE